jgi:O-antigen ligase
MVSSTVLGRPVPAARPQYLPRAVRISGIARTSFWFIFLLSLTNIMAAVMWYIATVSGVDQELGIYPVTFGICAALVLLFTRGRHHSLILTVSWIFWGIFALFGFAGEYQLTGTYFRFVLEVVIKPWMTIVGLPWLALRAISEDKAPRLIKATVLVMAILSLIAILQVAIPGFLKEIMSEQGRGAATLINPNAFGATVACVLFLSFIYPFDRRWLNFTARLLLTAGLAVSFSRAAFLATFVAWIVYGITAKRFGALFKSLLAVPILIAAVLVTIEMVETISPQQAARFEAVKAFLRLEFANDETDNRTDLWRGTMQTILDRDGVIMGLGHGSMTRVVGGLDPHNYYLFVWGNSGILALFALLAFHLILFQQAFTCQRPETRAAVLAIATLLAIIHMFDHGLIGRPYPGAVLACVVVAVAYGKRAAVEQRVARRAGQPMFRPMVRPVMR